MASMASYFADGCHACGFVFSIVTWVHWGDVIAGFYMFYHLDLYILPVLPGIPMGKPWGAKAHKSTNQQGLLKVAPLKVAPVLGLGQKTPGFMLSCFVVIFKCF